MAEFHLLKNGNILQSYLKLGISARPTIYSTSGGTATFYTSTVSDAKVPFNFGYSGTVDENSSTSMGRFFASSKTEYDSNVTTVPNKVGFVQTTCSISSANSTANITLVITNSDTEDIDVNSLYYEEQLKTGSSTSIRGLTTVCLLDKTVTIPAESSKTFNMIISFVE